MSADSPSYFRCTSDGCKRKWHVASLEYERARGVRPAVDLFTAPKEVSADGCPRCGGSLESEVGTFEE